jgi:ketosteroid isomerase-like protein
MLRTRTPALSRLLAATCLSVLALGCLALSQDDQARKEIEEIYAMRVMAIKKKDFAYLKKHEADDYVEKSKDGNVMNRKQADDEANEVFARVKEVWAYSSTITSMNNSKESNEVIVEVSDRGRLSLLGPDDKILKISAQGRSRDVWKRTQEGWRMKSHEELESNVELEGKPNK